MKHPTRTRLGNRGDWNDDLELPPAVFAGANSPTLAEAPNRCHRCQGPWRRVAEGYACYTCPGRWVASECLADTVSRPYANGERWPTVPRGKTGARGSS